MQSWSICLLDEGDGYYDNIPEQIMKVSRGIGSVKARNSASTDHYLNLIKEATTEHADSVRKQRAYVMC